ncbi:Hypothetical protein FKW44_025080 [Caligus rogercresseyi]|uniref:Uncharacterized protein n=1 Tax=Caligus rogercresseyi TaxID=217165 RepID=A0A7T8JS96_CALRO|nr:Hypothetical protein FKW44_025080 [Caligus rogercresseyi]
MSCPPLQSPAPIGHGPWGNLTRTRAVMIPLGLLRFKDGALWDRLFARYAKRGLGSSPEVCPIHRNV